MTDLASAPPVTERERRWVERINLVGALVASVLLAALHVGVTALIGDPTQPDHVLVAVFAYALAIGGWIVNSGRTAAYRGDPRKLDFRGRAGYRGARLTFPGMSAAIFGLLLAPYWEPGAMVLAIGGLTIASAGITAGAIGRFPKLGPRPFREGWPAIGTGPLPHLYPGFVAHVLWMRRLRARLVGGDPNRPLA